MAFYSPEDDAADWLEPDTELQDSATQVVTVPLIRTVPLVYKL